MHSFVNSGTFSYINFVYNMVFLNFQLKMTSILTMLLHGGTALLSSLLVMFITASQLMCGPLAVYLRNL